MSDDDDPDSERPRGPLPLTLFAAAGWTIGATLLLTLGVGIFLAIRPAAKDDLVSFVGCEAIAYLLTIFLILRVHAPEASVRDFLGIRRTSWLFIPIGALLGVAMGEPVSALFELILRAFPKEYEAQDLSSVPLGEKLMLGLMMVAIGPLVEELLFRGALFQTVKRHAPGAVIFSLGLFFGLAHLDVHVWIPLAMVGAVAGYLRWSSGSIFPSLAMHAVFNGLAFRDELGGVVDDHNIPWRLVAVGVAVTLTLLMSVHMLAKRSRTALVAQEMDKL